jgi:hypothetical protein
MYTKDNLEYYTKGYLEIHIAIDINVKIKTLILKVTDDKLHDEKRSYQKS